MTPILECLAVLDQKEGSGAGDTLRRRTLKVTDPDPSWLTDEHIAIIAAERSSDRFLAKFP